MFTLKKPLFIIAMLLACTTAWAQYKDTEKISKTISPDGLNRLLIDNINGNVRVEGYNGTEIKLEAVKKIMGKKEADVKQGMTELQLKTGVEEGHIAIYIESPEIKRSTKDDKKNEWWGYQWNNKNVPYEYKIDIVVKIPYQMELDARTVNGGIMEVVGVKSDEIRAINVNGDVSLKDISGKTTATTVNGDVTVSYAQNPNGASEYRTVNGSITVNCQPSLNANLYFKSMNGDFYTDFEVEPITNTATVVQSNNGKKTSFKINDDIRVKVGSGGIDCKFETLNGSVYVKKQ